MEAMEFVGVIILSFVMGLSTIAGIGGGGVVIPLLILFMKFDTRQSVALSQSTIFFCSIARFFFTLKEKHPLKNTVIIDYSIATVMLPTVLVGSMIGGKKITFLNAY
jgi:uncharacterized membrane protein YfcA